MRSKYQKPDYLFLQIIQWIFFILLILVCYLLETSGSGVKPLLLIPLSLCIASHTGEFRAMLTGVLCGLLLDIACHKLMGFNALLLVLCCVLTSLLYRYFLKQKLLNMLLLTSAFTLIQGYLDYIFYYAIWEHEDVSLIWERILFPSCIMTIISSVLFYFLIRKIAEKCGSHRVNKLEKTNLSVYQE